MRGGGVNREQWDERYRTDELIWKAEPNRFLVAELDGIAPGRALDVACGEGRNALWLAAKGWRVTGVDFSSAALAKGRRIASEQGLEVEYVEADVVEWPPPLGQFDAVVLMYLHLPAPERRQVLSHAKAALAPGGLLLVVGHDLSNLTQGTGGPQDATVLYRPEDLVTDLSGLRIEKAERVTRTVETEAGPRTAIDALVRAVRPL
jgi:2-polyprenyl-3-methyl-5-hydroxy-6-metoxy-1,4-benzoquinol methylase